MVVSLATHYAPPTHKKEWFDNATDNLSTRLFYREEWVDNRKSICRALQKEPTNQPLDSFHLLSRILFALRPRSKPEYYKRPEPEQGGVLVFPLFSFLYAASHNGAGQLFPRRIIFYAKSPPKSGDRFLFFHRHARFLQRPV